MEFQLQSEVIGAPPPPKITGRADFSLCDTYRYTLWRTWDHSTPTPRYANFLLLNPSKADAKKNDPTMRRCIGFSMDWGYGAMATTNIHAFRSTDPEMMKRAADPTGPENDRWILQVARDAAIVVLGFGTHGEFQGRGRKVIDMLRGNGIALHCLKLTQDLWPGHPLYLKKTSKPIPFP